MNAAENDKRYVLVVDANADDLFLTCLLLMRFGRNIFTAGTAEGAIEYMSVSPPVAVIAEAVPAGTILLSRMKSDLRFLNVPLILLSSSPDAALEERARTGEFAACLTKPINVEEFYRIVQVIIERGPRRKIRIPTNLTAALEDGRRAGQGHVTSLSEDGMFFRTLELRPIHTHLPVSVRIKDRTITVEAVVLYTRTFDAGPFKEPGMGMKFVEISPGDRELIKAFILERVREGTAQRNVKP